MTRVATPPGFGYPWYVRLILRLQRRKYGAELAPSRLWGRMPRTFLWQINGCAFCVDASSAAALERRAAPQKLAALESVASSPLFSERERAALAYAEAATDPAKRVDDACFTRLRTHFDEQAILELTALVAYQNLSSKFNSALAVPAQGFCRRAEDGAAHG